MTVIALLLTFAVAMSFAKGGSFCSYINPTNPSKPCAGKGVCITASLGQCEPIQNSGLPTDPYGTWVQNSDASKTINVTINTFNNCTGVEVSWSNIACKSACAQADGGLPIYLKSNCNAAGAIAPVAFFALLSALLVMMF